MINSDTLQTVLQPAGPQAEHIHFVWSLFLWVSVAVYFTVLAFIVAALRRKASDEPGSGDAKTAGHAVIAATVLSVITLFGLLGASAVKGHAISSLDRGNALKIRLTGHQWWWDVHYAAPAPSQEVKSANEIHIPVGRAVQFDLSSADVIHSFWVPNLHGKTDLLPGKTNTIWLRADRTGTYRGQCAEFCGLQHAHMALLVHAEPPDQFAAWYAQQLNPAVQPADAERAQGQKVFLASCAVCHTVRGTDAGGRFGPELTHVASRQTLAAGTLPFDDESLKRWISDPQGVKPGSNMPAIALESDDLRSLVRYLEELK
jgi:cytochrome c oxidase subunit 2